MLPDPSIIYRGVDALITAGREAANLGLVDGFSGNLSMRLSGQLFLVTAQGAIKGSLEPEDLVLMTASQQSPGKNPSSEAALHLYLYEAFPQCGSILHTHPANLQALELTGHPDSWQNLPLYESALWKDRVERVPAMPPGSSELARTCADIMRRKWGTSLPMPCGIWLMRHGLAACARDIKDCLAFTAEVEHLARLALICRTAAVRDSPENH